MVTGQARAGCAGWGLQNRDLPWPPGGPLHVLGASELPLSTGDEPYVAGS